MLDWPILGDEAKVIFSALGPIIVYYLCHDPFVVDLSGPSLPHSRHLPCTVDLSLLHNNKTSLSDPLSPIWHLVKGDDVDAMYTMYYWRQLTQSRLPGRPVEWSCQTTCPIHCAHMNKACNSALM